MKGSLLKILSVVNSKTEYVSSVHKDFISDPMDYAPRSVIYARPITKILENV